MAKKNKLVRANWYVFENQMKAIKRVAKSEGISESALVRKHLDFLKGKE